MPNREICISKSGKFRKKKKSGACPKGSKKKTIRVKGKKRKKKKRK